MPGGSYGRPLDDTVEAHVNVWRAARAHIEMARDRVSPPSPSRPRRAY